MWQHSCMSFVKAIQFLTQEEVAIVENIRKNRAPVTHIGNAAAGALHGRNYASSSLPNAVPNTGFTLFGTNILYNPERHQATEVTMNLNKRKRDSFELGFPPTFSGMPTPPVEIPQRVSNYSSRLMFRSTEGEPSTMVTTSQGPVAPAPAPAVQVFMDRGKQPIGQASGGSSASVRARYEPNPNPRFPPFL